MNRAATGVFLLALLLPQSLPAQPSGNELLKQVCADAPVGDRCPIAKAYPFGGSDKCTIELKGIHMEGRYVDPGATGGANGAVLILGYASNCGDGSLLFDKINSEYVFRKYEPQFAYQKCFQVKQDKDDRLFCVDGNKDDPSVSRLWFVKFLRAADEPLFILPQQLMDATNIGASRVTVDCPDRRKDLDVFGFEDVTQGPTDSSVTLTMSYIGQAERVKACDKSSSHKKVKAEVQRGNFVLDLNKLGQLVSQKSGTIFSYSRPDKP